jgi:hypothetical protein
LGVGTNSPVSGSVLDVASSGNTYPRIRSTAGSAAAVFFQNSDTGTTTGDGMYVGITSAEEGVIWNTENTDLRIATNNTERARITSGGDLQFNSGYGSVATAYGCRAWVNFNGTTNVGGFCTIRASGNVSSVADNGTGDYTINFATAMPDANYALLSGAGDKGASASNLGTYSFSSDSTPTTSAVRVAGVGGAGARLDYAYMFFGVFR